MAAIGKAQVALGIFLVWSVTNGAASAESALEMRGYCKAIAQEAQTAANNTILVPTTFEAGVCWGGFSAIQGYAVMAYTGETETFLKLCIPQSVTRKQAVEVFYNYANAHPEMLHQEWNQVAWLALKEAFPCPTLAD